MDRAKHEIVSLSPTTLRLLEFGEVLSEALENGVLDSLQDEIQEYRDGLEYLEEQRLAAQGRYLLGRLGSRDPKFQDRMRWLQNPETPLTDAERRGAIRYISQGETYG